MKWVILGLSLLVLVGCATHYYITQGDFVSIMLRKGKAREVYFASSLDQFKLHPAHPKGNGVWAIEMPATQAFQYFYMIDGVVYVPDCRLKESDDFGAQNCIFMPETLAARPDLRLTAE